MISLIIAQIRIRTSLIIQKHRKFVFATNCPPNPRVFFVFRVALLCCILYTFYINSYADNQGVYEMAGQREEIIAEFRRSARTLGFWWRVLITAGLYVVLLWRRNVITVTNRRVIQRTGNIVGGEETSMQIGRITDVTVRKGVLGAILGYGLIEVQSAGSAGAEIRFEGIAQPDRLKDTIFDLQDGVVRWWPYQNGDDEADAGSWYLNNNLLLGDNCVSGKKPLRHEVLTWHDIDKVVDILVPQIRSIGSIDGMILITRGGIIPGGLIAEALEISEVLTAAVSFSHDPTVKEQMKAWPKFLQFPDDRLLGGRRILTLMMYGEVVAQVPP